MDAMFAVLREAFMYRYRRSELRKMRWLMSELDKQ